ncbi:MAG: hypothetical protein GX352_05620 [Clostridiales bacterium]|nr:hypothetical protein [Clostridiales bacterium]
MNEFIEIKNLRYPKMAKCSSCKRVRDIYYKAMILDIDDRERIVGDLDLCKLCGENIARSQGEEVKGPDVLLKTFDLSL